MNLVIAVVVGLRDGVAVRRLNAVLYAVAIGIACGAVAVVQVGVDLRHRDVRGLENDFQGFLRFLHFINEQVSGSIICIHTVYLNDRIDGSVAYEVGSHRSNGSQVHASALVFVIHYDGLLEIIGGSLGIA